MVVHPLESSAKRSRSVRGALPSIAVHAAVILVAVHATAPAAISHERPAPPPRVHYFRNEPLPPVAPVSEWHSPAGGVRTIPPVAQVPTRTTWPTTIPDHLPDFDPSSQPVAVDRSEFGPGVKTGPLLDSGSAVRGSGAYSVADVERPVSPVGTAPMPTYPEALRSSGVRGSVTAEFLVDTAGHVEPGSFRALASDNDLFSAAVREAVLRTRFHPAEAGGRRVRQLVQESFSFVLQ